jgi:tetratricopeptide (TPR) repeat protein
MARKLSRVARCVLIVAATSALPPALAQSDVQVAPVTKQAMNPFAAKRAATAPQQSTSPANVEPISSPGPKVYQNPFARREQAPRFVTPRLQPGPMSRWHRMEQASARPQVDQRPIQALATGPGIVTAKGDLSAPLAQEERRTALFTVPGGDEPIDLTSPPDPAKFARKELQQPTWLLPHETQMAASAETSETYADERAVAHEEIDPFEEAEAADVVISDDAPVTESATATPKIEATVKAEIAAPAPSIVDVQPTPPQIEEPKTEEIVGTESEEIAGPELKLPGVQETVIAKAQHPGPVVKQLPQPAKRGAEDWYADAEKTAGTATTIDDLAAVVQLCRRGIECQPDPELRISLRSLAAWACNRSGEIESDQRREDEALKAFELAIQWDPKCWLALHNRAVSRAQQGDLDGALADFNRSLQLNPGLAVAFRNRGELLAATGRTEDAIADYTMALAQLPQDAELLTMRGESYHRLGEYEPALADLSQAIELAPHNAAALSQRGNVQAELGEFGKAIADFQQALAADANSAEAHRSLAWLLATCPEERFRNPRQAIAAAEAAAKLAAPGDPFVLDALAAANANAGQFDRAVRIQREAITNVPEDFAGPFQQRLALYADRQPFRNGTAGLVDENVRAASLETDRPPAR